MRHYNQGSFTAEEVNEELEERIYRKCLAQERSVSTPIVQCRTSHTSYMSRMGATQEAAVIETKLVHDDAEYIGTL